MGTLATLWQEHRTMMVFFIVLIVVIFLSPLCLFVRTIKKPGYRNPDNVL